MINNKGVIGIMLLLVIGFVGLCALYAHTGKRTLSPGAEGRYTNTQVNSMNTDSSNAVNATTNGVK